MQKGILEIICGSMFSGKSEELIRRLTRAQIARQKILVVKHTLDNRVTHEYITSHNKNKIKAITVTQAQEINNLITPDTTVIGIDEIQFFDQAIISVMCTLIDQGKRVIAAGLDLDFKGLPFGIMPTLLAIADNVTKLRAICINCGDDAHFTQRLVNGQPARFNDPLILIGAQEAYQARCRNCHSIDKPPFSESSL